MPNQNEISNLQSNLKRALLKASQATAEKVIADGEIKIKKEELKKSQPLQEIEAEQKSAAITNEVTVLLLSRIETLENKINELETKISTLNAALTATSPTP